MTLSIDLNCDLGESFGAYAIGKDSDVIRNISSANVACGFHAGDPRVMQRTVALAKEHGVSVGAHVGYPDLVGFGRRNMTFSPEEVTTDVIYQIGALSAFCGAAGVPLRHVKPHGALYNQAAGDPVLSAAIVTAVAAVDKNLMVFAPYGSALAESAEKAGLRVVSEVFADRAYQADGSLVPRNRPGALIKDPGDAVSRILRMVLHGRVATIDGNEISIKAETVCVHGDNPSALSLVVALRKELAAAGIAVAPPST